MSWLVYFFSLTEVSSPSLLSYN